MIFAFLTYMYFTLENLKNWLDAGIVFYTIAIVITTLISLLYYFTGVCESSYTRKEWQETTGEDKVTLQNFFKHSILNKCFFPKLYILALVFISMFPSIQTMKWVAGAYVTSESYTYLSSNEDAKKLPDNVLKAANSFLEEFSTEALTDIKNEVMEVVPTKEKVVELKDSLVDEVKELTQEQKQALINKLTSDNN